MGGECWGLGAWSAGCLEQDRGGHEAQGSAPSLAGGSGLGSVRHAQRCPEPVRYRPVGREHPQLAGSLEFSRERTPCVATLHHVFRRLDVDAFEAVLGRWAQECLGEGEAAIAIDGKALRGIHGREDRQESELGLASGLLANLDLTGRVVTGDALYAQRELSLSVLE